jgi:DNA polymerase/3'-5' exonuclease PolX
MENTLIARRLREYARYLNRKQASLYRVKAFRQAAATIEALDRPLYKLYEEHGRRGLETIPGIGSHIAFTVAELIRTGEFHAYKDEREFIAPERLANSYPDITRGETVGPLFSCDSVPS